MAAFYFRLCQDLALLLYVLMYKMCHKLHNLICKCNIVAKIILKYFNSFALYIVNCSRFVQTKHK